MSIIDLQGDRGGKTSVSITDIDGDEEKLESPPAPPVASRPLPPAARPRGRPILSAFSEIADLTSTSALGEELSGRLDKIDDKLDWIISRAKITADLRRDRHDDPPALPGSHLQPSAKSPGDHRASARSAASADAEHGAGTLRRSADEGGLRSIEPPAVVHATPPAGHGRGSGSRPPRLSRSQDSLDQAAAGSQPVSGQLSHPASRMPPRASRAGSSGTSLGVSLGAGPRGSNRAFSEGGTLIPNLSKRPGAAASPWAIPGRSGSLTRKLRGHGSQQSVPTMFKNQFLARRMYEKSASKDLAHVQQRIQSLPKAMRSNRYQAVDYIYTILDDPQSSKVAWWTALCLQALVLLSVLFTLMQTVEDPLLQGWPAAIVETVIDLVFLTEVCTRWCCAPNKVNFFFITHSWIDIAAASAVAVRAAAGFVLPQIQSQDDSIAIFLLCFVPILRLLKIIRHFETFNVLLQAVKMTMEALPMLLYAVALITMTFATLIYLVEPDLFESPFRAVWFCLVTVTTVGYGDYSPVTTAGITIVMILIIIGVMLMAVPVGIIGMQFNEVWNARDYSLLLSKTRARLHQWGYTAHDIPMLFKIVDYDDNGVLELDEFCELVKEMKIGLSEDRIVALFEHMDRDGSGALDAAEFALEVFPDTFVEAFGHAEKADFEKRASLHWMTSLAATINNGASKTSPFRRSKTAGT